MNIWQRAQWLLVYVPRQILWDYPDTIFFAEDSLLHSAIRFYRALRPFSHFALSLVLTAVIAAFGSRALVRATPAQILIEAVVMGGSESGGTQALSKISPLVPSAIQLEKDISELIYEPMIRYEQDGRITPVLAKTVLRIEEGADYEFELREDVTWHDGTPFGVEDVMRTLEIVSQLDQKNSNSYVQAVKQMIWERTGENSLRICTVSGEVSSLGGRGCSGPTGEKPILANFLELVSIKIIPQHLSDDLNALTVDKPEPRLNRFPVGTGPFKFGGVSEGEIVLNTNQEYYGRIPKLSQIRFRLFRTEEQAMQAIQNGQVHSFATSATGDLSTTRAYRNVRPVISPVLVNQYWALYFNLRKSPDGSTIAPSFFQDVNVRRAISSAIDRKKILQYMNGVGTEALGPIHSSSEYANLNIHLYGYNPEVAVSLLNEAGWTELDEDGTRTKDGEKLKFSLAYVDSPDRQRIALSIREDLRVVGIDLQLEAYPLQELTAQIVTPKLFETLLYGMVTFMDPDRYELFHSEQASNLNISSYVGSDLTKKISGNATIDVPRVDRLLEQGRSLNPIEEESKAKRLEVYQKFQELLAADVPVIFLYHPQFIYYTNMHVEGVSLEKSGSLELRFRSIYDWELV